MLGPQRQLLLYAGIGLSGATLDFLAFLLLTALGVLPVVATGLSVSLGIINNFILNAKFNFKVHDRLLSRFAKFYAVGLTGVVTSMLMVWVLTEFAGFGGVLAKLLTIPPVVLGQFLVNRAVTFRTLEPRPHDTPSHKVIS